MANLRALAERRVGNDYFRGLISKKLGRERKLDENDDLIDLILESDRLRQIYNDLFGSRLGESRLNAALEKAFSPSAVVLPGSVVTLPSAEDRCKLVWELAVADPRFDLLLKQALDDAKLAPAPVRGSTISRLSGMVDKIRSALTSGAAKHSNAVLAGSVAAGLLAGSAATKVIPPVIQTFSSETPHIDSLAIVSAINALTAQIKQQNALESQVVLKNELNVLGGSAIFPPEKYNNILFNKIDDLSKRVDGLQRETDVSIEVRSSLKALRMTAEHLDPLLDTVTKRAKEFDWKKESHCPGFDCLLLSNFDRELKNIAYDLGPFREFPDPTASTSIDPANKPPAHSVVEAIDALTTRNTELGKLAAAMSTGSKARELYSFSNVGGPGKHNVSAVLGKQRCTFDLALVDAKTDSVDFYLTSVSKDTCPSNMLRLDGTVLHQALNRPTKILSQVKSSNEVLDLITMELVSLHRAHVSQALRRADLVVESEEVNLPH